MRHWPNLGTTSHEPRHAKLYGRHIATDSSISFNIRAPTSAARIMFYDDQRREIERFHLDPRNGMYGVDIPADTWHNLVVIEPAVIFEAKDGVYKPISPEDVL